MAVKDIRSNLLQLIAFAATIVTNTTTNGAIIDTANNELGLMFALDMTARTDGTYTVQLHESDNADMSDSSQVTGDKLIGTPPALSAVVVSGATLSTFGAISTKRYVQLRIVSTSVTDGATLRAVCTQKAELMPVA